MAAHNKLTQKQVEAAKADGKQSKLADGGGLYLLLHPNGSKYWRMRYRHGGREKTLALGVYPAVSLKQARELARAARAQTAAGIDPVAERRRTRPGSGRSLPELAHEWQKSRIGQRARNTLEGDRFSLAYLTEYYKNNTDINDITTAGVSKFIEHLNRRNIPARAKRTVQILAQIWDYAVRRGIITDERRNPATTARPLLNTSKPKPQPHIRPDELTDFYRALQTAHDLHPYARPLLLLAALTAPRPNTLLSARWQDIDLSARLWHIPAAAMKTKNNFTQPLSDWAVEILQELYTQTGHTPHLFPCIRPRRKNDPRPPHVGIKFALNAIKRLGYDGKTPGKSNHTMHGFRHLLANICLTAGKDTLTTDLALGHISRAALQRAGFSSLHHYLTADSYRLQERRELAEWYSRRHRQAYEAAAQTPQNKKPPEKNSDGILPKTLAIKPKRY